MAGSRSISSGKSGQFVPRVLIFGTFFPEAPSFERLFRHGASRIFGTSFAVVAPDRRGDGWHDPRLNNWKRAQCLREFSA